MEGKCPFAHLKDGTLDLCDVALMNDALQVQADNELIRQEVAKRGK